MGVMQTFTPEETSAGYSSLEDHISVPDGIDSGMVQSVQQAGAPLRQWPKEITRLYHKEVSQRLSNEQHFLFLLGLLVCLSTIFVDVLVQPSMAQHGAILRVLAIAPVTMLGLYAGARGWRNILAFCVGAAPIAFIAVLVHFAFLLPAELCVRYLYGAVLVIGLGNVILPYSLRGLAIFDCTALFVLGISMALAGTQAISNNVDVLVVGALVSVATLPIAARFEKLRQDNFLLALGARIVGRELLDANRALRALSETDALTGIANRRRFERVFDEKITAPGDHGRGSDTIAVMMIDLDHFKAFNDTHGHQSGDHCLVLVASALTELFEEAGGTLARYGGEEFIGAARKRRREEALALAEAARLIIAEELRPAHERERSMITATVGVGIAPAEARLPIEELIEMADAALYAGKAAGRNRVELVEAEPAFGKGLAPGFG